MLQDHRFPITISQITLKRHFAVTASGQVAPSMPTSCISYPTKHFIVIPSMEVFRRLLRLACKHLSEILLGDISRSEWMIVPRIGFVSLYSVVQNLGVHGDLKMLTSGEITRITNALCILLCKFSSFISSSSRLHPAIAHRSRPDVRHRKL